ncbi:hypothetical protein CEB3_c22190 [Peptococcaceae bacterium CEB3]|nr:hypothetical protein CEB3_c22190 [Peptococcaceae bacterium CEB3]
MRRVDGFAGGVTRDGWRREDEKRWLKDLSIGRNGR